MRKWLTEEKKKYQASKARWERRLQPVADFGKHLERTGANMEATGRKLVSVGLQLMMVFTIPVAGLLFFGFLGATVGGLIALLALPGLWHKLTGK